MKQILVRSIGLVLLIGGVAGLVFCAAGLIALGRTQARIEIAILGQLDLVDQSLGATAEGLVLAGDSLAQATGTIDSLANMTSDVGHTISGTVTTVDAVSYLLGEQLPTVIVSMQTTLNSAADSAQAIDDILKVISNIPLLGTDRYKPEVPLSRGLMDVADSLDGLPESLGAARKGLTAAGSDLQVVGQDFSVMAEEISEIGSSVSEAESVLDQYQRTVADLQAMTKSARQSLPAWLQTARWALSLVLIWLGVAQLGLITQGWELLGRNRKPNSGSPAQSLN